MTYCLQSYGVLQGPRIFALDLHVDARLLPFPDNFSEEYGYTHAFKIGSPSTTKIYTDFLAHEKLENILDSDHAKTC